MRSMGRVRREEMKLFWFSCIVLTYIVCVANLTATSLIYVSTQTNYQANNYVFRKNDIAQGFVRLNNGFTVLPDACANMDILFSVSGAIDLRETGTMKLLRDLVLDSGVTLSSGGNFKGYGHTLVLDGNLDLPPGEIIHINGDIIIDGQGNKLTIGAKAQIFIDTNVTLTLCNMTITNQQHALTFPPIRCAALTSKLALDDVVITPAGDFLFPNGQLFIHNDVAITGTSAFIYTSPLPSFITSGACWYFGMNTTFSVAPATFTDAPYALNNTYTSNSFIRMADATSILYLDGCSVQATQTGCRFSKGTIAFDNKVSCKSDTTLTLTSITLRANQTFGTAAFSAVWSPDGKYVAVGGSNSSPGAKQVQVYSFNGTALTVVSGAQVVYGSTVYALDWSPDGRYLAIGGNSPTSGYEVQVYSFNGTTLTLISGAQVDYGSLVRSMDWSPDGRYLAIGGNSPTSVYEAQVYEFNGTTLTLISGAQVDYGTSVQSVSWSPDGNYLAIGGYIPTSGYEVQVYSFNGTALTAVSGAYVDYGDSGSYVDSVAWSPDGRYLAIGGGPSASGYELQVYRFTKTSLVLIPGAQAVYSTSGRIWLVVWSPDGRYVAIAGTGPTSSVYEVQVYSFDGITLTLISAAQIDYGTDVESVDWSRDGRYLAIAGNTPSAGHKEFEVYRSDFVNSTATQALSNSIVFGDRVGGSAYDAMVTVLAGSQVKLSGAMSYDNVNA
jgi:WD40 repeat protein